MKFRMNIEKLKKGRISRAENKGKRGQGDGMQEVPTECL